MSTSDFSPGSRGDSPSGERRGGGLNRGERGERKPHRTPESETPNYEHEFSLSERESRATSQSKPVASSGTNRATGIKLMLAMLSLENSLLRMKLEREQKTAGLRAIQREVESEVGDYGKENFDHVAKELLYYRERSQELALEVSKLKQVTQSGGTASSVAPLVARKGGTNSVLDKLHRVQIENTAQEAARGPWVYDQKFTDVRKRTLLVHSLSMWLDYSRKVNAGSTQLGMLGALAFSKWYLLSRFKLNPEEGDPGPDGGVFKRVWDRFRKELKVKKLYPSIEMPKNKYQLEREAFDFERLVHHRRKFRLLMKSILRNQNRRFKLLLVIGYFKLIANSGLLAMRDNRELRAMKGTEEEEDGPSEGLMRRRTVSVSPRLLFGPLEERRRERLYSQSSRGEFPYNIARSRQLNMPRAGRGWNGDGDVVESRDQATERSEMLAANGRVRGKLVRQASDARVSMARKYIQQQRRWDTQLQLGDIGDGAEPLDELEPSVADRRASRDSAALRLQLLRHSQNKTPNTQ